MAFSGSQKTRLGLSATTSSLYGSFVGKAAAVIQVVSTGAGGRSRRGRIYPRRVYIDGDLYWVHSAEEERALLGKRLHAAQEAAESPTARAADKRQARVAVKRLERRISAVDSQRQWMARLRDEDEQVLLLAFG